MKTKQFRTISRLSLMYLALVTLACTQLLPSVGQAANDDVSPSGSDSAAGTTTAPWITLQSAVSHLQPGDTLNIEAGYIRRFHRGLGRYRELFGTIAGTAGNPITIQADPSAAPGSVIINSRDNKTPMGIDLEPGMRLYHDQGITVTNGDGSIWSEGIKVAQSDHVNILNNTVYGVGKTGIFTSFSSDGLIESNVCYNNGEHGFYASNSPQNVQILNNISHDNSNGGIQVNADASMGGPGTAQNLVIANNIIYNNGATGGGALNFDGLQNSVVENNLLYNNHSSGIVLYDGDASEGSVNNVIVNNTVVQASGARPALNNNTNSYGNTLLNNIFLGDMLVDAGSTPAAFANNILLSGYTNKGDYVFPTSTLATASALFVNAAGNDYHLRTSSPAIDTGTSTYRASQ